jgi:hypothetical protein
MDDVPDNAITWVVLDLISKVVVCSSAWWRICDHPASVTSSVIALSAPRFSCFQKPHCCPPARKRSSSEIGIRMCRNARFGFKSFRSIKRLTELGEIPPRYWQASFSFRAPCLTEAVLVAFVFISLTKGCCHPAANIRCANADERKSHGSLSFSIGVQTFRQIAFLPSSVRIAPLIRERVLKQRILGRKTPLRP